MDINIMSSFRKQIFLINYSIQRKEEKLSTSLSSKSLAKKVKFANTIFFEDSFLLPFYILIQYLQLYGL